MNTRYVKIISILIMTCILIAVGSWFYAEKYATVPQHHEKTIEALDKKQKTVLELTAAATLTSTMLTMLPGDTATPIADKLADISSYLLLVMCAIFLEKFLITVTGFVAFRILIPLACLLGILFLISKRAWFGQMALRTFLFGIMIYAAVPASVRVSNMIETTYQAQIDATMQLAKDTTEMAEKQVDQVSKTEIEEDSTSKKNLLDKTKDMIGSVQQSVQGVVQQITEVPENLIESARDYLTHFMEAVAVMIITSCVIPILVLIFFYWMVKMFISIDLSISGLHEIGQTPFSFKELRTK